MKEMLKEMIAYANRELRNSGWKKLFFVAGMWFYVILVLGANTIYSWPAFVAFYKATWYVLTN